MSDGALGRPGRSGATGFVYETPQRKMLVGRGALELGALPLAPVLTHCGGLGMLPTSPSLNFLTNGRIAALY